MQLIIDVTMHITFQFGKMEIARDRYLKQLIASQGNGLIKVITGIRRCGKSFLLKVLFKKHLLSQGVRKEDIMVVELDAKRGIRFRNPLVLSEHVEEWLRGATGQRYLFIDEIQMSDEVENPYNPKGKAITFYDTLNDFMHIENLDVYVTGSNSRMLSSDIKTEFRGRGDEIRLHPLSFSEYLSAVNKDQRDAFEDYMRFGGMPFCLSRQDDASKEAYLRSLFNLVYFNDIIERWEIEHPELLERIVDFICSSIGSLTNPSNITNALQAQFGKTGAVNTVAAYIAHLEDAYLFSKVNRYDVKGKRYFDYPYKYYCEDVGLRNARTGFRQQEPTHIIENILYNELILRGYSVDIGYVESFETKEGKRQRVPREIDFVVNKSDQRVYIQSAYALDTDEKRIKELKPFSLTGDSFRKIIVRNDIGKSWYDDTGVLNVNVINFLLEPGLLI
ncbi:MAG: ATP-binding protein [Victivallales bacterium]|nr:ATP-binding protein [Victivallales bacterium]